MVESTRQVRPKERFRPIDETSVHDRVPLFLAEQADARHPPDERVEDLPGYQPLPDYAFARASRRTARGSRIVTGLFALSAATAMIALFSADTRALFVNAKASLSGAGSAQADAQPALPLPSAAPKAVLARSEPTAPAPGSPSRDEITAAYQSAVKTRNMAAEPPSREALPASRRIDPEELAVLLRRAKYLLSIGDIVSARLLLERAADAQEAEAALMLAGTYDPRVLGTQNIRSIAPDPAMAQLWYRKAAQFGSIDAGRRLSQLEN